MTASQNRIVAHQRHPKLPVLKATQGGCLILGGRQRHLDAFQPATDCFRQFGHIWIVGASLGRPFAESSHQHSTLDREFRGQQSRLDDRDQGCSGSETVDLRRGGMNLFRHLAIVARTRVVGFMIQSSLTKIRPLSKAGTRLGRFCQARSSGSYDPGYLIQRFQSMRSIAALAAGRSKRAGSKSSPAHVRTSSVSSL